MSNDPTPDPEVQGALDARWRVLRATEERDRTRALAETSIDKVIVFPVSVAAAGGFAYLAGIASLAYPASVHPVLAWTLFVVGVATAVFGAIWARRARDEWRAAPGRLPALDDAADEALVEWEEAEDRIEDRHPGFADTGEIELLWEESK